MTTRRLAGIALMVGLAWPAVADPPRSAIVCASRPPMIGSPTPELLACGWTQWPLTLEPDVPEPTGCHWAVRLPPVRAIWSMRWQCLTEPLCGRHGCYRPRCPILCPQENAIFADGFESGDTSAWSRSGP